MKFDIKHAESLSRGEAILKGLFGAIYIGIPHLFLLGFVQIGVGFSMFFGYLSVLFTGKYPQGLFDFNIKAMRWQYRFISRLLLLADGYPAFGLNAQDDALTLSAENTGVPIAKAWLRCFFGFFFVLVPHGFVLAFFAIPLVFVIYLTFIMGFVVAAKGHYPQGLQKYMVGIFRWGLRVNLYFILMSDEYPPFNGEMTEAERAEGTGSPASNDEILDA